MEDFGANFWTLPPPFNMIVLLVAIPVLGGIITTLISNVRRFAERRSEQQFKLEMIQNGLSVEEAQRWASLSVKRPGSD